MLNKLSLLCFSLLLVLMTACGDSKDSIETNQATINENNAQPLAIAATDATNIGDNKAQLGVLFESVFSNLQTQKSGISTSAVVSGNCGGSATYPDDVTQQQNTISGSVNFDNFCMDGGESGQVIANGEISFIAQVKNNELVSMAIKLADFMLSYNGNTVTINSTVAVSQTSGNYDVQFETTTEFTGSQGHALRVENLAITGNRISGVTIESGRVYHPDHGYVDISTTETLMFEGCDNGNPVSGTVLLQGSDDTNAEIVFTSCTTYEVCVNANSVCTPYSW